MDQADRLLLNVAQTSFPVIRRPYSELAQVAAITEDEALARIQQMKRQGIIRRLGAVLDSRRLGYYSTLCAAKVPSEKIALLAALLENNPGVTHNYLRTHEYNMWFTLIVPDKQKVEPTLAALRQKSGIEAIYSLPAERVFKIKVDFNFFAGLGQENSTLKDENKTVKVENRFVEIIKGDSYPSVKGPTGEQIELIRLIQEDLPDGLQPYQELAQKLSWQEEKVLQEILAMKNSGIIRRFGAVLRHQKAGFVANAMGVWQVPENRIEEVGQLMSTFPQISHCYQRPMLPDWQYNLFTMIHGVKPEDCGEVMEKAAAVTGIDKFMMLFSTAELKKTSMKYFAD